MWPIACYQAFLIHPYGTTHKAEVSGFWVTAGVRCIRHRCVSRQPLPIPLPYPRIFSPLVSRHGDVFIPPGHSLTLPNGSYPPWQNSPTTRPSENGHVHGNADVESVPVLTRLMSSQHNPELASQQLQQFRGENVTCTLGWGVAQQLL